MKFFLRSAFILLLISSFFVNKSYSSHVAGGEITWRCDGNGKYIFTVNTYRDCTGILLSSLPQTLTHNFPGIPDIICPLLSITDVSPVCKDFTTRISCGDLTVNNNGNPGSVARYKYVSAPIDLNGVPAPTSSGYIIYAIAACCRPGDALNFNDVGEGQTLRARMLPYIPNGQSQANDLSFCYDNSPDFSEAPIVVTYQFGREYVYSSNSIDKDLDELSYAFDYPLGDSETDSLEFINGYSLPFPIPRVNQPAPDPITGSMSFDPVQTGRFISVIKVTSRKCGQIVSEIFRDITIQIQSDPNPNPLTRNVQPRIEKIFDNKTSFDTTIVAGDTLLFKISVGDSNISNTPSLQGMNVHVNGIGMGNSNISLTDCPYPPCAILNKDIFINAITPATQPVVITNQVANGSIDTLGYGYSNQPTAANPNTEFYFYWPTSCNNLNQIDDCGGVESVIYNFVITAKDDYCSSPGRDIRSFSVTLTPPVFVTDPEVRCVSVAPNQRDITLSWDTVKGDKRTFRGYEIYKGETELILLANITNNNPAVTIVGGPANLATFNQKSYTDLNQDLSGNKTMNYYVRALNSCSEYSIPPVYVRPMKLDAIIQAGGPTVRLSWNKFRNDKLNSSTSNYKIFRTVNGIRTQLLNPPPVSTKTIETYIDRTKLCGKKAFYEIQLDDNLPCSSISTIDSVEFIPILASAKADTVCANTPTTFRATASGGRAPLTYNWSGDNGFTSADINSGTATFTYKNPGTYYYQVRVRDFLGCDSLYEDSVTVVGVPLTLINADTVCTGKVTTFTTISDAGLRSPATYTWDFGDGSPDQVVVGVSSVTHAYTNKQIFAVSLSIEDKFGCIATFDTFALVTEPVVNITTDTTCLGVPIALKSKIDFAKKPIQYFWSSDKGAIAPTNGNVLNDSVPNYPYINVVGNHEVTLRIVDANGCEDTGIVFITVTPGLVVSLLTSDVCIGNPTLFISDSTTFTGTPPYTYQLIETTNNITIPMFTDNASFTFPSTGIYNLTLNITDSKGCTGTSSVITEVYDNPSFTFNFIDSTCVGDTTDFTIDFPIGRDSSDFTYLWSGDDGLADTNYFPFFIYNSVGLKKVSLTIADASGCFFSADTTIDICEPDAPLIFLPSAFSPNGDNINDNLFATTKNINKFQMRVFNRWGQLVYETKNVDFQWSGLDKATGTLIQSGVYVYDIQASGFLKSISMRGTIVLVE